MGTRSPQSACSLQAMPGMKAEQQPLAPKPQHHNPGRAAACTPRPCQGQAQGRKERCAGGSGFRRPRKA